MISQVGVQKSSLQTITLKAQTENCLSGNRNLRRKVTTYQRVHIGPLGRMQILATIHIFFIYHPDF